jgi:ABC-type multidrug transport system ATPase subunit
LYARITVRQNLEFAADVSMLPRREREQSIGSLLERLSLLPLADRRADRLSTGQRQRVRLAMALVHRPALVLLDEPDASLDEEARALLGGVLADIVRGGDSVVWSTPRGTSVDLPFDRSLVLERGRLA